MYSEREDPYSSLKQDFSKIFHDNHLGSFTNATDLGFLDFDRTYFDNYNNAVDDNVGSLMADVRQDGRINAPRENLPYQDVLSAYSPMGRAHPNANNFGSAQSYYGNSRQQPYQQDYIGYPAPHGQSHYYPHHYDSHLTQQNYDDLDYYFQPQDMLDNHGDDPLSLMWSDEVVRAPKNRSRSGSYAYADQMAKQRTNPIYTHQHEQNRPEVYNQEYEVKRDQMMRRPQDIPKNPIMKVEAQHSTTNNYSMDYNPQYMDDRRINEKPKQNLGQIQNKPMAKVDNYMDDDDDDEDGFGEGKGRSTRGLRVLSLKVKEIVALKKRTSYKDVAESLTIELRQKLGGKAQKDDAKDEQNVKRRVYDALNVLIAADILKKEGKIVFCNPSAYHIGASNTKKTSREEREKLLFEVQEARKRNKARAESLHELVFKCLAIKNLIQTNKAKLESESGENPKIRSSSVSATRIEIVQENPSLKPKNEDVIKFPFIVLLSSSPENSMNLNMDAAQKQLAIESKKAFNIFGDIDVLLKMGMHYVSREMFEQIIPQELHKFVPKYYLSALK